MADRALSLRSPNAHSLVLMFAREDDVDLARQRIAPSADRRNVVSLTDEKAKREWGEGDRAEAAEGVRHA